jgi:hypothetical protein
MCRLKTLVLLIFLATQASLTAQVVPRPQTQQQQQQRPDPSDTIPVPPFRFEPPVSPFGAFARSLLLPGWGQAIMGRRGTGAFFVFWEGIALTMTVKSVRQLHYQESIDVHPDSLDNKRAEVEDWLVLLIFNHLVAGAEAFVSAHLWDFPADLGARALPNGSVGVGVAIRLGGKSAPFKKTRADLALPHR